MKIRDAFIKQYYPLVKHIASKVIMGMPQGIEHDELVSFGTFGLIDAIEKFNPEKDVNFMTYAFIRIRGSIFDELRSIDWIPRSVRQKTREVNVAIGTLESKLGRTATEQEVADALGLSEKEYLKTQQGILSINEVWHSGSENDKVSIGDSIASPSSLNPEVISEQNEIQRVVMGAINGLSAKEKKVLKLYYDKGKKFKEIGKTLNITASRVQQIHANAIKRLKAKLTNSRKGII